MPFGEDLTDALAAAHAQKRTARAYASSMTPDDVANLAGLHTAYPNLGAAALPLARSGVKAGSSVAQRASEAKAKRDTNKVVFASSRTGSALGRMWGSIADEVTGAVSTAAEVAKPIVRYGAAGAQLPVELVMAGIRTTAAEVGIGEGEGYQLGDPGQLLRQTTVGAGVAEAHDRGKLLDMLKGRGDEKLAGDGWFIDPKGSKTGKRQAAEARAANMIDGHAFTLGRGVASALPFEQGSRGHTVVSGLIDLTATLALDPLTYAGGGLAKGQRARHVLDRGDAVEVTLPARVRAQDAPVAEGHVRLYRGSNEPLDPKRIGDKGARFTTQKDYAEQHGGTKYLYQIDVPQERMMSTTFGDALGDGPLPHTFLDRDTAAKATLVRQPGKAAGEPAAVTPVVKQGGRTLARPDGTPLQPDDIITVWHTTSADNARSLTAGGFRVGGKPRKQATVIEDQTVADMLGKNVGDALDYEPGRGQGDGLYVTLTKPAGEAFGDTAVPVRVRYGDLASPPERPRLDATRSLLVGDGYIPRDLPASSFGDDAARVASPPSIAEEFGLVDSVRKTVLPEVAAKWLMGPKGNKVVQHLTDEKDFERMRRATGKKLPVSVLVDLVDATDSVTVRNILADSISSGQARDVLTFKPDRFRPARLAGMMPGERLDLDDIDDAVEQLDRFQRNVLLDADTISANNLALARAGTKGERYQIVEQVMATVEQGLVKQGVDPVDAGQVTRLFRTARDDMRAYFIDELGDNAAIPGVKIGDDGRPLPAPHLLDELLDRYVPLPNARELKRAVRKYQTIKTLEGSKGYTVTRDTADFLTGTLFKPFALALRPAWTVRVVGEEQVRMAAAGKASLFHHPLSYITWIAGESPGKLNRLMRGGRGGSDALGQKWADEAALPDSVTEWAQSLNRGSAGWRDRSRILTKHFGVYTKKDPEYAEGWQHELIQLASDPVAREVLRNGAVVAKNKFWRGNLQGVRNELDAGLPEVGFGLRETADAYVDSVVKRIHVKTQGDADLIDAVRTGKLKIDGKSHVLTDGFNANPKVRARLKDMAAAGGGPVKVKGRLAVRVGEDGQSLAKVAQHYDQAVERLFHALGSVPTNKLSRSPMFRQSYWERVEETLPMLTKAERARAIRAAKEAGMSRKMVARMRATADRQKVSGNLLLEDADHVAKQYALKQTRDLLYSLHEKSQAADALRVLFPFGEAWREVLTRWTRLGVDPRTMNPKVPYRASQGIPAAQEAGIFYTDPTTGQEMFALPGSEWLTEKLTGVPMKLEAPVAGLNMFGQVIPGVGPVVAFAASKIIPESPDYDFLRSAFLPFGDPDYSGGAVESLLPSYIKKLIAAGGGGTAEQKRLLASQAADVMAYLYSTGEYDLSDPADQERLLDDARGKAKALYVIRALAQSTAPSSPRGQYAALDKDGRLHALFALKEDYRKMLDQDARTATSRFVEKYGEFAFLATVGKTRDEGANPVTDTADLLARNHPDQAKRFPKTIGLFAAPSDEYSFTEQDRQIAAGTRKVQSLEDIRDLGNVRVANAIYAQAKAQSADQEWLRAVRDKLKAAYPGYTGQPDDLGRTEELVQELIRASSDEVLAETEAGQGLVIYLQARQQATDAARAAGLAGFEESKAAKPLRDWLRQSGRQIVKEYPEFRGMWDRVFTRELPEDEESQP